MQNQAELQTLIDRWSTVPVSPYYGFGRVTLYGPRGIRAEIPLHGDPISFWKQCETLLEQGWMTTAPGLEEGEQKEMFGYVLRRMVKSRTGMCSRVYLYLDHDGMTRSHLAHYLNTQADVDDFEHATGMKIDHIPVWPADQAPERGKNPDGDRCIVRAPRPFGVVFKINPEYKEGDKDKTKRLFVRWADQKPQASQTPAESAKPASETNGATANLTPEVAHIIQQWSDSLRDLDIKAKEAGTTEAALLTRWVADEWDSTPEAAKPAIWRKIAEASNRLKLVRHDRTWTKPGEPVPESESVPF